MLLGGSCPVVLALVCLGSALGGPASAEAIATAPPGATTPATEPQSTAVTPTVAGTVLDGAGLAMRGVLVVLRNASTGSERSARTDGRGSFTFGRVAAGRYEIIAAISGFSPARIQTEVPDAGALEIRLEPALYEESVTIKSEAGVDRLREGATAPVTVVTGADIRSAGYETVSDALGEVAGVVSRRGSEGTAAGGEQVQGIDSRQVLVLVDGQPLVGARGIKSGVLNLDREATRGLERIEIVKGAASALYGSDAMGGVINLIPREPRRPLELGAGLSGGNFGASDAYADAGGVRPWGTLFATAGRHQRDAFDLTPTTPDTSGASLRRNNASGRVTAALGSSWALAGNATGYWNTQRGQSIGELGPQADTTDSSGQTVGARLSRMLGASTTLELRAYHGRYDETADGTLLAGATPLEPGELAQRLSKTDATLSRVLDEHHQVRGGVEWIADEYEGTNRIRDTDGDSVNTGVAWGQYDLNLGGIAFATGLRYDNHSEFGGAWSPKVAASGKVTDRLTARVSYGRGFRAPDVGQLYYRFLNPTNLYQVIGNPLLQPERSGSWQGGVQARLPLRWRVGLNLFHNEVKNLIESVNLGFIASPGQLAEIVEREQIDPSFTLQLNRLLFLYKNVSRVTTKGAEVDSDIRIGSQVRLSGTYAYLDAINTETGADLPGRNRHHGTARLDWASTRGGFRANLRGTFYSSWIVSSTRSTSGATTTTRAPGFNMWDLTASKSLVAGTELFAAIDNLTDNQDPNTGSLAPGGGALPIYRPEIGRTFRIGMRWGWTR